MTVTQIAANATTLIIQADFPEVPVATVFAYWTQPHLLEQWWPQHAELQAWEGGSYHLSWPSIQQDLRGRYVTFQPDERIDFTWLWDDDTDEKGERLVSLQFNGAGEQGSTLIVSHGPYGLTPEEQAIRLEHHLAGWLYFLPRLQTAMAQSHHD